MTKMLFFIRGIEVSGGLSINVVDADDDQFITPYSKLLLGFGSGDVTIDGTLITHNDNATSFRLRGASSVNDPSAGADVQSYAGIFSNVIFAGTSSSGLETRAVFGGNVEMDLELQAPRQLRISAVDDSQTDGQVRIASKTDVTIHARTDAEVDSINHIIFDRTVTGSTGAGNTSPATIETDSGDMVLWPGRQGADATAVIVARTAIQLVSHSVALAGAISSPVEGQVIYVTDGDSGSPTLAVYDGASWKRVALGATIST